MRSAEGRSFLTRSEVRMGKSSGLATGSSQSEAFRSTMASPVEVVVLSRKRARGLRRRNAAANFNAIPTSPTWCPRAGSMSVPVMIASTWRPRSAIPWRS